MIREPGALADALLEWFRSRERDVPWRKETDPYRIWVAEVMAQQTRLATVREYYGPFLERFPDLSSLAEADRDDVMKAWEGLGFYARARNLHRAARQLAVEHDGRLPEDPAELRSLPGVGPYTAGAVASIAFGRPEPAVDGNARRVLCRLLDRGEPSSARLRAAARELLASRPGSAAALNQALMDLGGQVCTASAPACPECPLRESCLARRRGTVSLRPRSTRPVPPPHEDIGVGVVWRERELLIARRPPEGLLGDLWEFPGGKVEAGETPREAVRRELREEMEIEVRVGDPVARVEHAYSHLRVTLHAYHAWHRSGSIRARAATAWRWVRPARLPEFAFPAANHRIIESLRGSEAPPASLR